MGMRPFAGVQALAGTAQPVFGTASTAAFTPSVDPFSNKLGPGSNQTQVTVAVTSTKGFLPGKVVAVGPGSAFNPSATSPVQLDIGVVKKIIDSTHLVIQGLQNAHASGDWVVLNDTVGNVHIRPVVTTAAAYIGDASTVAAGDQSVMDVLPIVAAGAAPGYVFDAESIGQSQPFNLSQFWIIGTAADTFVARYTEI